MRLLNLPPQYKEHPERTATHLRHLLNATDNVTTWGHVLSPKWISSSSNLAWSFFEILNQQQGDYLIQNLPGTSINDRPLEAHWGPQASPLTTT